MVAAKYRPAEMKLQPPRAVLITGTSSGLGLAMAVHLAGTGWQVYASMRDPSRRGDLDVAVAQAGVDEHLIRVVHLDVTEPTSIRSALHDICAETGGRLDALINNAALNVEACLEDIEIAEARRLIDTVVLGAAEVTQAALPALRNSFDPRLIFMSSYAAVTGGPATTMYSAAKAAIERLAEALAWEVAADRIRISVIRPGFHRSNIFTANSGRVRPPDSRYRLIYDRIDPLLEAAVRHARDPSNVACKVAEILDTRSPKFRYHVGWDSWLVVLANPFIPQRLRERVARALFTTGPKSNKIGRRRINQG